MMRLILGVDHSYIDFLFIFRSIFIIKSNYKLWHSASEYSITFEGFAL